MTPEQQQVIDLYLSTKLPYSVIGDQFGFTRSKVAGIIDRHCPKDAKKRGTPGGGRNKPRRKDAFVVSNNAVIYGPPRNPRESRGCRWINGDPAEAWAYCQRKQQPGSPYCGEHHAKCYRSPETVRAARANSKQAKREYWETA